MFRSGSASRRERAPEHPETTSDAPEALAGFAGWRHLRRVAKARDTIDEEVRQLRRASRRTQWIWLAAIVGNVLVAAALLGGPYVRARYRALESRREFARFAACMTGGEALEDPGLGLPEGSPEGYVDRFRSDPSWPGVCAPALSRVAQEDTFWLLPDVRHAEGEVRRAVEMVLGELESAADAPRDGVVPERPWLALQRLIAGLTLWAQEADVRRGLLEPAIEVPMPTTIIPTRVPLDAASSAELSIRSRGDGIEVVAIDARGISWTRVGGGLTEVRRMRRPALVQGVVFGATPIVVWAMDESRCADDACARRAMGAAPLDEDERELPAPRWLAAHPIRPLHGSVQVVGAELQVLAHAPGGLAHRRFPLEALSPMDDDTESSSGAPGSEDAEQGENEETVIPLVPESERRITNATRGWITPERIAGDTLITINTQDEVRLGDSTLENIEWVSAHDSHAFVGGMQTWWITSDAHPVRIETPPLITHEAVVLDDVVALIGRDVRGVGYVARCADTACTVHELGELMYLDAGVVGQEILVAFTVEDHGAIQLLRLDESGAIVPLDPPAACWSEAGGLCGRPFIAFAEGRILLGARDRTDLLVVESSEGTRWQPMRGLR